MENKSALGEENITPTELMDNILENLSTPYTQTVLLKPKQNLDQYIEAQIHADILLSNDVAFLVADIAYQDTSIEISFKKLCKKYQIELLWRQGFELTMEAAIANFRGTEIPNMAIQVAVNNKINVSILVETEKRLIKDLKNKEKLNAQLQQLKYLYHTLVQFGQPISL